MLTVKKSTCRSCHAFCPINVTFDEGQVVKVEGNPDAPIYEGFICPKGRALTATHSRLDRLKRHLKRMPDGSFQKISSEELIEDISAKLNKIIKKHGPDAVASYIGNTIYEHQAYGPLMLSFLEKIGSQNFYSPAAIDQPGLNITDALHGTWAGGWPRNDALDALVLIGTNPIISKQYFGQNPGQMLKRLHKQGVKLIVIDPRRTESARRADVHLQIIPGEDPTVLAGLLYLLIKNDAVNQAFVDNNCTGFAELADAVSAFTPEYVAERAGIDVSDLVKASDILANARMANLSPGVGGSMATRGTLMFYLARCLQTIRGFWPGEGDEVSHPNAMSPLRKFRAQPNAPTPGWGFGKTSRVRGLQQTVGGMPTAALPEEILLPGEGQIRALFLHGGAMRTWPQTELVKQALESLELLVVPDVEANLSPTAKMATHVVATKLPFEVPVMSKFVEQANVVHPGYGWEEPYANYNEALLEPPEDSDLLEPWEIYYRVAQKLGIQLEIGEMYDPTAPRIKLDMEKSPTTDDLYEIMSKGAIVPLSTVKQHPNGKVFDEARITIGPRDSDCESRLELANGVMLEELEEVRQESYMARRNTDQDYPFLFIPSRIQATTNATYRPEGILTVPYNPAYMNSASLEEIGVMPGDKVRISSRHGSIVGFVGIDNDLRPGVMAMTHGFGGNPGDPDYDPHRDGANVNELLSVLDDYDPYIGMPRMGAVPVSIEACA